MAVGTKVIVFYDAEQAHQFEKLRARFPIHAALTYPIDAARLEAALAAGVPTGTPGSRPAQRGRRPRSSRKRTRCPVITSARR